MPLLKYFLSVGTLLSLFLYGLSEYLEPPHTKSRAGLPPANAVEAFRPTPAPPIIEEAEARFEEASLAPVETKQLTKTAKVRRAKPRKQRNQVVQRGENSRDNFAYTPSRPLFFNWR